MGVFRPTKDARVVLRVTDEQHERWTKTAAKEGKTLSLWLRDLADKAAGPAKGKKS